MSIAEWPFTYLRARYEDAVEWCAGRSGLLRLPLLLYFAWLGVRQLLDPGYWSPFDSLNLPIHEMGHLLTGGLGPFFCAFAGTLFQTAAPVAGMFMFLRQRDYFAIAVCFGWLSTNLYQIGVYMADARAQALPLVTVGNPPGGVDHDWTYMFSRLGLLEYDTTIGWLTCQLGLVSMLVCLVLGGWLIYLMLTRRKTAPSEPSPSPRPPFSRPDARDPGAAPNPSPGLRKRFE